MFPKTHVAVYNCLSLQFQRIWHLFWPLQAPDTHDMHKHMQIKHSYSWNEKNKILRNVTVLLKRMRLKTFHYPFSILNELVVSKNLQISLFLCSVTFLYIFLVLPNPYLSTVVHYNTTLLIWLLWEKKFSLDQFEFPTPW